VRGYNERSLGIELCNPGRYPDWHDSGSQRMEHSYSASQLEKLTRFLNELTEYLPGLKHISGHEHLDVERIPASDDPAIRIRRKRDPGPLFPWPDVLSATRLEFLSPRQDSSTSRR
jgi:N-acetylmuramoyl-L-alanine amidase